MSVNTALSANLALAAILAEQSAYGCAATVTAEGLLLRGFSPSTAVRPERPLSFALLSSPEGDAAIRDAVAGIEAELHDAPGGRGGLLTGESA